MQPIHTLDQLIPRLQSSPVKALVAVVCPNDPNTVYAVEQALEHKIARFRLFGTADLARQSAVIAAHPDEVEWVTCDTPDDAARAAVADVKAGRSDVLMKGLINTDNLLHAILNKETGILPHGDVLTHLAIAQIPSYHKLLFFTDAAVIPQPTLKQRTAMVRYAVETCHAFHIEEPKVALVHCTEKVSEKFPVTLDIVEIKETALRGDFGRCVVDGPIDAKCACDTAAAKVKGIGSPIAGEADVLILPDLEAGNVFYKAITVFAGAEIAGIVCGTTSPVVLPSRSDHGPSKFYSIAVACLTALAKKQ